MTDGDMPSPSDESKGPGDTGGMPPMPPAPPSRDIPAAPSPTILGLRVPLTGGLPPLQQRWTILIRILLAIPQFVVLFLVGVGAIFVAVAAWFVALFTGEVPVTLASFLGRFVRWSTRVSAYFYLLTDLYPPFNGEDDARYPVGVELPCPTRLNQLAVLGRLLLVIPAGIVYALQSGGLSVLVFFLWIAALVLGRLPDPIYRAVATTVRYSTRVSAYFLMLTPEYPWGWKGDEPNVAPLDEVGEDPTVTRFDFVLVGWAQAWVWIFIVLGLLYQARGRRGY